MTPPPLPQTSPRHILPAFLLCFTLCAHRVYAGRIVTGIAQMAWVWSAFLWVERTCRDLLAIVHSKPLGLETVERIGEWEQTHGVPIVPMLTLIAAGIWIAADATLLLAGKFTDSQGRKITRWV